MSSIVLVHGSWYGAWCWDRVAARLREAGHTVVAPDLPAHGADTSPVAQATLASYVERVASAIDAPAIVVGHSMAGVVLSELAERHPEKVKKLVYVAAYLLADGETIFQHAMSDAGSVLGPHLRPDEAKGILSVAPEGYEAALASGCSAEDVTLVREKARSEPLAPLATPIHVSAERFGRVPRLFVHTLSDRAVSTTLQAKLLIATPTETVTLASGHSPFFSHAAELSALLARAAG